MPKKVFSISKGERSTDFLKSRYVESFGRSALLLLLLGLCFGFYSQLNRTYEWLYYAGISCALVAFGLSLFKPRYGDIVLGFCIVFLPFLGAGHLNLLVASWLLASFLRRAPSKLSHHSFRSDNWAVFVSLAILILPFVLGAFYTFQLEADPLLLHTVLQGGGLREFNRYLAKGHFAWHQAVLIALGYLAFALVAVQLLGDKKKLNTVSIGLALGSLVCSAVCYAQWFELHKWISFNRDAFWVYTGRFEGTTTDPNALGLVSMILIPLFLYSALTDGSSRCRALYWVSSISLALAALSSGSRTAMAGLFVLLIILQIKKRGGVLKTTVAGLAIFMLAVFVLSNATINSSLQRYSPSVSLTRVLKSLHPQKAEERVLSSRVIMGSIAIEMFKEQPLLGVGLHRFYGLQSHVAKRHDIPLGTWRDNANNFYLQILSELGVLGFGLFVIGALGLYFHAFSSTSEEDTKAGSATTFHRCLLLMLVLILLSGPHLLFDELRYLVAFLIAGSFLSVRGRDSLLFKRLAVPVSLLATVSYLVLACSAIEPKNRQGFWGLEGNTVWTGKKAKLKICPSPLEPTILSVRAAHPELPLTFTAKYRNGKKIKLHAISREWVELPIPMSFPGWLELEVDKLWRPPNDRRWLGLMVRLPKEGCP